MVDIHLCQFIDMIRQRQTIGRNAELDVGSDAYLKYVSYVQSHFGRSCWMIDKRVKADRAETWDGWQSIPCLQSKRAELSVIAVSFARIDEPC